MKTPSLASPSQQEALLSVRDLRVALQTAHGHVEALRGVSFTMQRGETLGLIGESGCGKSLTALAVMGLQLGYLLGGSILIETVFSWPGTGFLLNSAIFQRDLPLLQGTILVLATFFVILNMLVDIIQTTLDPRIARG